MEKEIRNVNLSIYMGCGEIVPFQKVHLSLQPTPIELRTINHHFNNPDDHSISIHYQSWNFKMDIDSIKDLFNEESKRIHEIMANNSYGDDEFYDYVPDYLRTLVSISAALCYHAQGNEPMDITQALFEGVTYFRYNLLSALITEYGKDWGKNYYSDDIYQGILDDLERIVDRYQLNRVFSKNFDYNSVLRFSVTHIVD